MSQPEGPPPMDNDRDEMQKSIRESKKQNYPKQNDTRGGTAQFEQKHYNSNKEIFEYSPMV